MTARAPFASATATVVDARSTSITQHDTPLHVRRRQVLTAEEHVEPHLARLLHELAFALEELRVDVARLELRMHMHAAEERHRSSSRLR